MLTQLHWIYQYGRRYWKAMILYTVLGVAGTGISLVSSFISKDLVDITPVIRQENCSAPLQP